MRPSDPRVRALLAPARGLLAAVAAAGTVGGLLVIAQAWAVAGLVVAALHGEDLVGWSLVTLGVLAARGAAGSLSDVLSARAAGVVTTDLRRRLLLGALSRREGDASGDRAVLITRGVTAVEPYVARYLPALVLAAVLPTLTVAAIATQDLLSATIVISTLPLVPVFGALVGMATRDRAAEQQRALAALSGHFLDVVRGLPTLVAFRRAWPQSRRIAEITDRYRVTTLATLRIAFASSAVLELVATLSVALVAVTVGVRLASGGIGLHTALVVLLLAPEAYWPLRRVGAEFHAAAEGTATFAAAADLLDDAAPRTSVTVPAGADIALTDVVATYPGRATPALAVDSLHIPRRGVTVLTGPSGCGKSTLLAVLAGLLPMTGRADAGPGGSGEAAVVRFDDPAWQAQVAWLPQQPQFVAGTVADNLRLARPSARDAELWHALRQVALETRVAALPAGLDTALGEDGATLSAGERARLALARVLLADRPWVLLDEPAAHLDDLTERIITDTVVDLGTRSAVVVVAHRGTLADVADAVVRLERPAAPAASATHRADTRRDASPVRRTTCGASGTDAVAATPSSDPATATRPGFADSTLLGALASASGVALTATAGWLIVQASGRPPVLTLLVAIVGVRAFGLARPALRYLERIRSHDTALRLLARRRVEVYDALVPLVPARLGRRRGDLLSAVVDDVDAVVDRELRVRMPVRQLLLVGALAGVVSTALLPVAGAVVLAFVGAAGGVAWWLPRHGARAAEQALVTTRAQISEAVVEAIQVADELRMWQAADGAGDRVADLTRRSARAARNAASWLAAGRALVLVLTGGAVASAALLAAPAVSAGTLSGPVMALLVLVPLALADVVLPVADAGALSVRCAAADARLRRLARVAPAVRDEAPTATAAGTEIVVREARARWSVDAPLTVPLDLRLRPGERLAVVGASGSGKSTLAALLLRFLDPVVGAVRLGGSTLDSLPLDEVRRLTGLVEDHPHVFSTTLVENVRLARPDATDREVHDALCRARLGDWLDTLPEGLQTWLGDGHAAVSGGERTRIGIARSLLADQPVLVLDEPTAHLDHALATQIAAEVLTGPRDRAILWISHGVVGRDLVDGVLDLDACAALRTTDERPLPAAQPGRRSL